jgi:hypothetical protein
VRSRKEINPSPSGNIYRVFFFPPRIADVLLFRRIALYVCRPLNGKHKKRNLGVLCGSAVNIFFKKDCLNNYCRISKDGAYTSVREHFKSDHNAGHGQKMLV